MTDGRWRAQAPHRPCNFVSWDDTSALFDWLGLRPMTEFEFEKAARGPQRPVPADYPWGTASSAALLRVVQPSRDLAHAGADSERVLDEATKVELGASFYWVLDLAGSVWERVVSAGHSAGRAFVGSHGDGVLDEHGRATNADWPRTAPDGTTAPGVGFRGGAEYFKPATPDNPTNPHSPVAMRTYAGWGGAERYKTYSARGCRIAPAAAARRTPSPAEAEALATELLQRRDRDQAARAHDLSKLEGDALRRALAEAEAVDRDNTARMQEVVATFGWPTRAMVGEAGADAAFLLVQHADAAPDFQAACLPLLRAAAARGEASPRGVAYLTARGRPAEGGPELYASQ
jgi:hypothetical protein